MATCGFRKLPRDCQTLSWAPGSIRKGNTKWFAESYLTGHDKSKVLLAIKMPSSLTCKKHTGGSHEKLNLQISSARGTSFYFFEWTSYTIFSVPIISALDGNSRKVPCIRTATSTGPWTLGWPKGHETAAFLHVTTRNIQNTHILDQISSSSQALPMRGFKNSARAFFSLQKAGG